MTVKVLAKRTKFILQPLDFGILAALKKRYQFKMAQNAVDIIDSVVTENPYKVDMKRAMMWLYEICALFLSDTIYNCWVEYGLVQIAA